MSTTLRYALAPVGFVALAACNQVLGLSPTGLGIEVASATPAVGPTAGGTPVTITGTNLDGVDQVTFGGAPATVTLVSDSRVDVVTPAHVMGAVDVVVTRTADGARGTSPDAFTYVALNLVQSTGASQQTPLPISTTLTGTTRGNLLVAAVMYVSSGGTVLVSDNLGNRFALAGTRAWYKDSAIYYLHDIPGGDATITASTTDGASAPITLSVAEYSGAVRTADAVAGFGANNSTGTGIPGVEPVQGVAAAPVPGDLAYILVFASSPSAMAPGAGLAQHPSKLGDTLIEDTSAAVTTADTIATIDTTAGSFARWVAFVVTIKAE